MAKHIRNYARLKRQILRHFKDKRKEVQGRIAGLTAETWRSDDEPLGLVRWRDETDEAWEQRLQKEKALILARHVECLKKDLPRWEKSELARLEAADRAKELWQLSISMTWRKSRTWGMCPRVEAWVHVVDENGVISLEGDGPFRGYASGCGYDKASAAICDALRSSHAMDRYCIEHPSLWSLYAVEGRNCLPRFSFSAKGVSTFEEVFRGDYQYKRGLVPHKGCPRWNIVHVDEKMSDTWEITRVTRKGRA